MSNKPNNTIHTLYPIMVYVPLIISGRDKYEYEADTVGAFGNELSALRGLLRELIEQELVCPEYMFDKAGRGEDGEDDNDGEYTYKGYALTVGDDDGNIQKLTNLICTFKDLDEICNDLGDSFYEDGWKIRIDKFALQDVLNIDG
jgi:hypothetical protein